MRCPSCGRNQTGQVGNREYYCWNCCLEFHGAPGGWRVFAVDPDGALVEVAPPGQGPAPAVPEPEAPAGAAVPALR
jgi:hypothetical protein